MFPWERFDPFVADLTNAICTNGLQRPDPATDPDDDREAWPEQLCRMPTVDHRPRTLRCAPATKGHRRSCDGLDTGALKPKENTLGFTRNDPALF